MVPDATDRTTMTPSNGHARLYDEVRRHVLALLGERGVTGVVLLDRAGRLVIHEGEEPCGDVEALAGHFLRAAGATRGIAAQPAHDDGPSWFARDERHGAWMAPAGRGLTLLAYFEPDMNPGLAWRAAAATATALRGLLDGPDTPAADPDRDEHGPIWE